MIRVGATTGRYYCDGRYCGYALTYLPPCREDNGDDSGEVICPDCWASMFIAWPPAPPAERVAT